MEDRQLLHRVCWLAVWCLMLAGCQNVERLASQPEIELAGAFSAAGEVPLDEMWWGSFNDPQLDSLIERGLRDNFSIQSAWDRLRQAEQVAVKAGAPLLPSVNYNASYRRSWQDVSDNSSYSNKDGLGLAAGYVIDFWGRLDSTAQAAALDVQAAKEDVAAAAVTLSAGIAKTWYQYVESRLQEQLIAKQIDANAKVLEIITVQFRKGKVGASDVFRQRQLIEASQGQLIKAKENSELLLHRLAVLVGSDPSSYSVEAAGALVKPGPLPKVGIPSQLLTHRPDLMSAYKSIQAADYRVATAITDQYPRISLSAGLDTNPSHANDIFDDWLASLAANLTGPLFDAGLKKAEVQRTQAVLSQLINTYRQSILAAVQEVEDALSQQRYQAEYVNNLSTQLELARQVYDRTRQSYLKGQVDYIRVLDSLVSQQSLERGELTAKRQLIESRVDLCRAISGDFTADFTTEDTESTERKEVLATDLHR